MGLTQSKIDKTGHNGFVKTASTGEKFTQMGGVLFATGAGVPSANLSSEFGATWTSGRGLAFNISDLKFYGYYGGTTWSVIP